MGRAGGRGCRTGGHADSDTVAMRGASGSNVAVQTMFRRPISLCLSAHLALSSSLSASESTPTNFELFNHAAETSNLNPSFPASPLHPHAAHVVGEWLADLLLALALEL